MGSKKLPRVCCVALPCLFDLASFFHLSFKNMLYTCIHVHAGPPPTIGNLSIEYEYVNNHYNIKISWTPPFSLLNNLSYDVTISTRNDTFTTRLLDPYYTFEVSDDKFCDSLEISVTAMNPAGEGDNVTKIAVGLYFGTS